jgi:hypothetical protein
MNFGNNSIFGAVNRRSRFGAIGDNLDGDMTHRIQLEVTYKNPDNFGLWYSPGTVGQAQSTAAKFTGLMFHMSTEKNSDGLNATTDNGTNTRSDGVTTKDPVTYGTLSQETKNANGVVTKGNDFFTNAYQFYLEIYYGLAEGVKYTSNLGYNTVSQAYKDYIDAGESTWTVVQLAIQISFNDPLPLPSLSSWTADRLRTIPLSPFKFSTNNPPNYELAAAECTRLQILLLSFDSYDHLRLSNLTGIAEGIWTDTSGKASTGGDSVSIKTTQNLDWLSKPYGDYTFGVAIINTVLTVGNQQFRYKFPLSVSDLNIANAHVSGLPSVSNSPTGLSVTVTYY